MMRRARLLGLVWLALAPGVALAGMPSPVLTDWATMRFSTISFFTMLLLVSALVVKSLWNALAKDFTKLPRIGYGRSLSLVFLWGFLFLFVLTMIAGARELMTPEAWETDGATYKLTSRGTVEDGDRDTSSRSLEERRRSLAQLKLILWDYALKHDGSFPEALDAPELEGRRSDVAGMPGLSYGYVPGRTADDDALLAFEPDVFGDARLALHADGAMAVVSGGEIREMLGGGEQP
jgi:hypothetical protein